MNKYANQQNYSIKMKKCWKMHTNSKYKIFSFETLVKRIMHLESIAYKINQKVCTLQWNPGPIVLKYNINILFIIIYYNDCWYTRRDRSNIPTKRCHHHDRNIFKIPILIILTYNIIIMSLVHYIIIHRYVVYTSFVRSHRYEI